jgi:hypothetical protein
MKLRAMLAPWSDSVEFLLSEKRDGVLSVVHVVEMKALPDGIVMEPSFSLNREDAQSLMDNLWNCGLRPTEGAGSAGALSATQNHLEDMRRLVFEKDNVDRRPI